MRGRRRPQPVLKQQGKSWLPSLGSVRSPAAFLLPLAAAVLVIVIITIAARSAFSLQRVVFSGNTHLSDEELRSVSGLAGGENLLVLSGKKVAAAMAKSPWVRSAAVRKELPDSVHVLIQEAEPFALLDMRGRLYIVDERGRMLEELKDTPVPFLPVIAGNPFDAKEAYAEGINLAAAIKKTTLLSSKDRIEVIAHKLQELAVNIDGVVIKVGQGEYDEKLGRLMELGEEIKSRRIPVDYIDLRFANRVVVKPINEVIR